MGKRRRPKEPLNDIHLQVSAQHKTNLIAIAKAKNITMGEVVERLVSGALDRAVKRAAGRHNDAA